LEKPIKFESRQPRHLRYRNHYRSYLVFFLASCCLIIPYWSLRFLGGDANLIFKEQNYEIAITLSYFFIFGAFYFFWLNPRLKRSVQVYADYVKLHDGKKSEDVHFNEIESVTVVCWSLFYLKMKNGHKYYFSSSLERVDYIWEKIKDTRPDLLVDIDFESFRLKLVQYDHHQKRKEWFFRHKFADVINWLILPLLFIGVSYTVQSQNIFINQRGMYFFRLGMYSLLVLLLTTFIFSMLLKKFIFDARIKKQMGEKYTDKIRDLEFEGIIIQRSKFFQLVTSCFIFSLIIRMDINLYSLTKIKEDINELKIYRGTTVFIDNRFNCVDCQYYLKEGDVVIFGRGHLGQVMAKPGEFVGEFLLDGQGRGLANENVQRVPINHLAVRSGDGANLSFIKMDDLIGKINK